MELINKFIAILVFLLCLIISCSVLLSDKRSKINLAFFTTGILVDLWIGFGYLGLNIALPLFFLRLNFAAVSLFFISFYYFTIYFPTINLKRNYVVEFSLLSTGILFSILSVFSNKIIDAISVDSDHKINYSMGDAKYFFYSYALISAAIITYTLIKKYYSCDNLNKSKVRYFLIGFLIWAFFNVIFNVLLPIINPDGLKYYAYGDYSAIFFLGFTAYAITKHGLFNIKVIATETTVIALSIGLLVEVFLSNNFTEGALKAIIWVLATYGGYVLIKSVKKEIEQKEELSRLAKKLDEANMHLEELDEEKDNFISMASHELNTPVAAINGYLSMILEENMGGGKIPAKTKRYLEIVFNSSKRLAALVKDLLNVSRIESGRIHIIYTEAQFEDVINQAIAEVDSKAKEVGHKVTFEKPAGKLPTTYIDTPRIIEVIINIIGNAIKYTEPPGKIVVKAHADDGKIVVSVEDNGRGIPKDKYDHVFEKFTQVNVLKDEVKGTGLGMFITKNLIELHNGKLWFKSSIDEKDHGTIFYFSLPILKEKPFDEHEGEGAVVKLK